MKFLIIAMFLIYFMVGCFDVRVTPHDITIHQQKNVTLFTLIRSSLP
jgi:hypothetical protein